MKCKKCKKSGFFLNVDKNGLCDTCASREKEKSRFERETGALKMQLCAAEERVKILTAAIEERDQQIQRLKKRIEYFEPQKAGNTFEFDRPIPQKFRPQEISDRNPSIAFARNYCVVDTETTGLVMGTDRIVEIAIIKVQDGEVAARYSTLVNPEKRITPGASAVNGLSDADVAGAPSFAEIAEEVSELLDDGTVIGHNPTFDANFLFRELAACGIKKQFFCFDTRRYA